MTIYLGQFYINWSLIDHNQQYITIINDYDPGIIFVKES